MEEFHYDHTPYLIHDPANLYSSLGVTTSGFESFLCPSVSRNVAGDTVKDNNTSPSVKPPSLGVSQSELMSTQALALVPRDVKGKRETNLTVEPEVESQAEPRTGKVGITVVRSLLKRKTTLSNLPRGAGTYFPVQQHPTGVGWPRQVKSLMPLSMLKRGWFPIFRSCRGQPSPVMACLDSPSLVKPFTALYPVSAQIILIPRRALMLEVLCSLRCALPTFKILVETKSNDLIGEDDLLLWDSVCGGWSKVRESLECPGSEGFSQVFFLVLVCPNLLCN